jgi:RNA polymerase sigma-70 factor (ECF subfamily)
MLRDEELSTADTAGALSISEGNVEVRLFRGRAMVRRSIFERAGVRAATFRSTVFPLETARQKAMPTA